ncbi:MAG: ribose 5-phosphate isomerase B [Alphaproteobacteria bacterium]|nr:ribose 5-phosphate isomerase B [Alphaproteobacteria bacterium]
MPSETIALAADHGGFALKGEIKSALQARGLDVLDLGTDSADSVDYPDFGYALAEAIRSGRATRGVVLCGSGIGISIAANRFPEVRAALCHEPLSAALSRRHNDANVLALGGRLIGPELARACLDAFLDTPFEGGRHARRVAKLGAPPTGGPVNRHTDEGDSQ